MTRDEAYTTLPAIRALAVEARAVAVRQDAVATTAQVTRWGTSRATVARRVARGEWRRLFPGVVLLQSGPPSWRQRARAALLYAGADAALSHRSAAYVRGVLPSPGLLIHVMVPHVRTVVAQPGLVVHRRRTIPWAGGGLRAVDAEEAVLCLATEAATDDDLVGLVCDAVRGGARPDVLVERAAERPRMRNRHLLVDVLRAVDDGIESPLELRYRRDVERAHGLPRAVAQRRERVGGRRIRADRVYDGLGVRVELDGQLAHPFGATDDDVWRDNAVLLASGDLTLRYRWWHVVATPCEAAQQVAAALHARGWSGTPRPCGPGCSIR
jgi:hypothetical protein